MLHQPGTIARLCVTLAVAAAVFAVAAAADSPPPATFVGSFDGHGGQVYAVARLPNGIMLASGGFDDSARLWTLALSKDAKNATTTPGKILSGHYGPVLTLAFSSDGRSLLTGGLDKTARLWWVRGSPAINTIKAKGGALSSLVVRQQGDSTDGGVIAAGDQAGAINFWDSFGQAIATIETPETDVPKLAFRPGSANQIVSASGPLARLWQLPVAQPLPISTQAGTRLSAASPDRSRLASASGKTLTVWDTQSGKKLETTFELPDAKVVALAWGPPGKVAAAMDDGTVQVVDAVAGGKPVWASDKVASPIVAVALRKDGEQAVVGCDDNTIRVIRKRQGKPTGEVVDPPLGKHGGAVVALAFVPVDAVQLVSASRDGTASLWDGAPASEKTKNPLKRFDHKMQPVNTLALSSDGARLLTGAVDHLVRVFSINGKDEGPTVTLKHEEAVTSVDISDDQDRIVVGTNDGRLHVWDLKHQLELERLSNPGKQIEAAWIFDKGSKVLTARSGGQAFVWAPAARVVYQGNLGPINAIAFGKDGKLLYTGSAAAEIWGFNVETGDKAGSSPIAAPAEPGKKHPIFSVTALKGTLVAAGLDDGRVWVFDTAKKKDQGNQPYAPIVAHQPGKPVTAIISTSGGDRIISGSEDLALKMWNAANGQPVTIYSGLENTVTSLALSHDDRWLVAGVKSKSSVAFDLKSPDPTSASRQYLDGETAVMGIGIWESAENSRTSTKAADSVRSPFFVAAWENGTIDLWAPDPPGPYKTFEDHGAQVYAVAWEPGDGHMATASADGWVRIWSPVQPSKPLGKVPGSDVATKTTGYDTPVVYAVAYQPHGNGLLAVAGKDPDIRLWDVTNPKTPKLTGKSEHGDDAVYCLAFDSTGTRLASGAKGRDAASEGRVVLWEIKDQKPVKLYDMKKPDPRKTDPKKPVLTSVYSVGFSPDGRWLAAVEYGEPYEHVEKEKDAGKYQGSLLIWNVAHGDKEEPSRTELLLGAKALGLAWVEVSSNGLLAVPASDGKVYLYQPPRAIGVAER